jgi:hypothetical protein
MNQFFEEKKLLFDEKRTDIKIFRGHSDLSQGLVDFSQLLYHWSAPEGELEYLNFFIFAKKNRKKCEREQNYNPEMNLCPNF